MKLSLCLLLSTFVLSTQAQPPAAPLNFSNVPVPPPKVKSKDTKKEPMKMVIDSESLNFDKDTNIAIFRQKVRLRSENMDVDGQEMEVHFKKEPTADAPKTPAPVAPKSPPPPAFDPNKPNPSKEEAAQNGAAGPKPGDGSQNIEKAWIRGKGSIVTIVKRDSKGSSVCKSGDAFFEDKTGKLTLTIFPEVEQEGTILRATDRSTTIFLDREGKITADGPLKTIRPSSTGKTPAADPPPPATGSTPR